MSVRFLILLVVLLPTLGLALVAGTTGLRVRSERDAAAHVERDVAELLTIIEARVVAADEEVASSVLTIGADLGASPQDLEELYGVDYTAVLEEARAAVDENSLLSTNLHVADPMSALRDLRPRIDEGMVSFVELHEVARALTDELDAVWRARLERVARNSDMSRLPAEIHRRLDGLDCAYTLLSAGSDRATVTSKLLIGEPTVDDRERLLDATSRYADAVRDLQVHGGESTLVALEAHQADPEAASFERVLDRSVRIALTGESSPLSDDVVAFGAAFSNGPRWAEGLTATVRAAAEDLRSAAAHEAASAARDVRLLWLGAAVLAALSIGGAMLVARSVVRPAVQLEAAAHQIHEGSFHIDEIEVRGPRELADIATAFNDMASTLAAVEAHAVALADDPEAPILSERLPGRTGRALQAALNHLRTSMRMAEQQRRELEVAATHDSLTNLLNRPAALQMIDHDLHRVAREGGTVAALYVDLDGLKAINDTYHHAAGDEALRLTARALLASTRAADVVGRLGGDEFIVAGVFDDVPGEVEALAKRVHDAVASKALSCDGVDVPLRCSIGIAVADPTDTVETLIGKADRALYMAKARGRDQVACYEPTHVPTNPQSA